VPYRPRGGKLEPRRDYSADGRHARRVAPVAGWPATGLSPRCWNARGPSSGSLLLALAAVGGIVDALSYVGLGKVFTANMTGNTVLLGVALATGNGTGAARSAVALGGFCLGVAVGLVMTPEKGRWPHAVRVVLWLEAAALAVLLAAWAIRGVTPVRYGLVALAAVAMGAQSAATRDSDVGGVNTTFMTSTLINAISRTILRLRRVPEPGGGPALPAGAWVVYGIAALAGALTSHAWGAVAVIPPLAIVCVVGLIALRESS
jgi:uncharacterized membrane protein YoaK (UPF0700 family)